MRLLGLSFLLVGCVGLHPRRVPHLSVAVEPPPVFVEAQVSASASARASASASSDMVIGEPQFGAGHAAGDSDLHPAESADMDSLLEHGAVEHGTVEHGTVAHGTVEHGTVEHGTVEHGTVEHGTVEHGAVEHGTDAHGAVEDGTAAGNLEANGAIETAGSVSASVAASVSLNGTPGIEGEALGGGAGVRAVGHGSAQLRAVLRVGLNVNGERLRLGDLGPLLEGNASAGGELATGPNVEASATLEHSQLPAAGGETNLVVRVRGGEAPSARARVRVHLVIDRSSSMQSTWPTVLDAALTVVDQLDRDDEVQIVAYGSDAQEMLPPTRVGNGRAVRRALGTISVGGGTNIEAGLHAAYRRITPAGPQPLVILLSDGVPNGGAFTADELAPMAARVRATYGCTTTVVGLGNQFDPNVLRGISEAGGGGYHIAQQASELGAVLRGELHTQLRIAARQVRVGVALPDGVELLDVDQSVNATHSNGSVALTFPQLRQAEEHHVVLRVRVRGGAGSQTVARVRVAYQDPRAMLQHAEKTVSVRYGHAAELATSDAALVIADKDLGHAVDVASQHVLNGRANQAAAVLRAHVTRTEAHAGFRAHARLRVRTNAVAHFAQALETLVTPASHVERREVSLAMGSLAVRLLR